MAHMRRECANREEHRAFLSVAPEQLSSLTGGVVFDARTGSGLFPFPFLCSSPVPRQFLAKLAKPREE
jgi:hypothetical protein